MNDVKKRYIAISSLHQTAMRFTTQFIDAFAVFLGAGASFMRFLAMVPAIAMLLSEFIGAFLARNVVRTLILCAVVNNIVWFAIALIPLFPGSQLGWLLFLYALQKVFETMREPADVALAGSLVPEKARGSYFSRLYKIVGIVGLVTTLLGVIYFRITGTVWWAYASIFFAGALAGLLTVWLYRRMKEPPKQPEAKALDGEFRSYCIKSAFFNFAVYTGSPFFALYLLREVGLPLWLYLAAELVRILTQYVFYSTIGRLADRYGDRPVLVIGAVGTAAAIALVALVTPERIWMIWPLHVMLGLAWGMTDLSLFNILLDVSDGRGRPVATAKQRIWLAAAQIIGPLVGYQLVAAVSLQMVFVLSAGLRIVGAIFFSTMKEPRNRKPYSASYVFTRLINYSLLAPHHKPVLRRPWK
jgi:MFS family permease